MSRPNPADSIMLGIYSRLTQASDVLSTKSAILQSTADKLSQDKSAIAQMREEADERFDAAISAANAEMELGMASGFAAAASAVRSDHVLRGKLASPIGGDLSFYVDPSSKVLDRKLDATQKEVAKSEKAIDDSSTTAAASDRTHAMRESIQRLLDMIKSMNPQI